MCRISMLQKYHKRFWVISLVLPFAFAPYSATICSPVVSRFRVNLTKDGGIVLGYQLDGHRFVLRKNMGRRL